MGLSCSLLKKNSDVYIKIWESDIYDQKICSTRHISARVQPARCLAAAGQAGGSGLFECSLHHALLPCSLKPSSVYLFGLCINSLCLAIGQFWKLFENSIKAACIEWASYCSMAPKSSLWIRSSIHQFPKLSGVGEFSAGWILWLLPDRRRKWIVVAC